MIKGLISPGGSAVRGRCEMKKQACLIFIMLCGTALMAQKTSPAATKVPDLSQLQRMAARFAPTEIKVDTTMLAPGDQKALVNLIEASRLLNTIFMEQIWSGDLALYHKLQQDRTPLGRERLHYFWLNKSPWSALDGNTAFLPDVPAHKLPGANFYPEDMTKEEFESWVKTLPKEQQDEATGFFTVIRRDAQRKLQIVRYSQAYRPELEQAARLLHEAAAATPNATLKKFLNSRADAFLSYNYRTSDEDWMDLDAPLDITIGPYETYNDEIFGYKAAFESYVNLRDENETAKLGFFSQHLQELENNLPEDPQYRVAKLGASAPIRVVNEIFASGDGDHGVKTAAYNLPNDDVVVQEKGSKRVMLKNVQEAKFRSTLVPISKVVLAPDERTQLNFDAFFTHILAHELMHGLGPHQIKVAGRETNPRLELKDVYSAIEEAKADVTAMWALDFMMQHPELSQNPALKAFNEKQLYITYLASAFRTLRFGITEAHGKGMAVQMNYIMDKGGFVARPDGTFAVDFTKIKQAFRDLDHDLLTLEATGDYAGAKKMLSELGVIRPVVQKAIDRLSGVPVDIDAHFVTADKLAPAGNRSAADARKSKNPGH
jgi:hypothetical protein